MTVDDVTELTETQRTAMRRKLAQTANLPVDDLRLRTTAGAITGVIMASLHGAPMDPEDIYRSLDYLDAGLPLDDTD